MFRYALTICACVAVVGNALAAADLRLKLEIYDVAVGQIDFGAADRFALVLENAGPTTIKVLRPWDWRMPSNAWSYRIDGPVDARCSHYEDVPPDATLPIGAPPRSWEIPPKSSQRVDLSLAGVGDAGSYTIVVVYDGSAAPEGFYNGKATAQEDFKIEAPSPEDAEAINAWRGKNPEKPMCVFPVGMQLTPKAWILKHYPRTTYAALVVYGQVGGVTGNPSMALKTIDTGSFFSGGHVPDEAGRSESGFVSVTSEEALAWRAKWTELVLTHHPDIWFADHLRLRRALDQLAQKNMTMASSALKTLANDSKDASVAAEAREYLGLLVERGLIDKTEVEGLTKRTGTPPPTAGR